MLDTTLDQIASGTTPYHASHADIDAACKALGGIGFTILATSRVGIAVAGKPGAFEELTGGQLVTFERLMHAEADRLRYVTHIDVVGSDQPETRCVAGIKAHAQTEFEGVLVERPRMLQGVFPTPIPPIVPRSYLRVPDDVALLLNAIPAHRQGHVGAGTYVPLRL